LRHSKKLRHLPKIDTANLHKNMHICTQADIKKYFAEVFTSHTSVSSTSISMINGFELERNQCIQCSYCKITSANFIENNIGQCQQCYAFACIDCLNNSEMENVYKNNSYQCEQSANEEYPLCGATSYTQHETEHTCKFIIKETSKVINEVCCDSCCEIIPSRNNFYRSENALENNYGENDTIDVCLECATDPTKETRELLERCKCKMFYYENKENYIFHYTNFGSILNWIQIIHFTVDECDAFQMILMNLNPYDENYLRLCIRNVVEEDAWYYSTYNVMPNKKMALNELVKLLNPICDSEDPMSDFENTFRLPIYKP
jgi:hypothetical protein